MNATIKCKCGCKQAPMPRSASWLQLCGPSARQLTPPATSAEYRALRAQYGYDAPAERQDASLPTPPRGTVVEFNDALTFTVR